MTEKLRRMELDSVFKDKVNITLFGLLQYQIDDDWEIRNSLSLSLYKLLSNLYVVSSNWWSFKISTFISNSWQQN